jgi:hypothetical protein
LYWPGLPLSRSENFLKVIDEIPVEVLDAPLDLALALQVRRKRKMSVDAKKLNNLLHTHSIFRWLDLLNKRTANCLNKRINSKPLKLHPYSVNDSSTLKASE